MFTGPFVVGFMKTIYTVTESESQVEVCVSLVSPEGDIGDKVVLVEVFSNIADSAATASKLANSQMTICVTIHDECC